MRSIFGVVLLFFATLLLSYADSDFDGVEDEVDRCPNTPITELVDINGCSVRSLLSLHHADVIVGISYSESDYQRLNTTDTLSTTLQLDYYYKNFSLQVSSSYFTTSGDAFSDAGFYDTFLGASYQLEIMDSLLFRMGGGLLLPTYQTELRNNKTDYIASLNLSYNLEKFNLFSSLSYTLVGDSDTLIEYSDASVQAVNYQNSTASSLGIGYYSSESSYLSCAYNFSNSIYLNEQDIKTLSFYGNYEISKSYFTTLSYAYGISESASKNYVALRFGYLY